MSKSNITNSLLFLIFCILAVFSCTTKQEEITIQESPAEVTDKDAVREEPEVVIVEQTPQIIIETTPQNVVDEPVPEIASIQPEKHAEYSRSVSELKGEVITQDVFENDKKTILHIIDDLSEIMIKKDYRKWINYISPQSLNYWQNSANLEAVSARLPVKGILLKSLEDYFKFFFIPSRLNVTVDEIRYISSTSVKVVQVRGDQDIICYYFEKIKGEWMLILDTL